MQPALDALVYIVDDDASVREALAWLLRSRSYLSQSFDSAEAFEAHLGTETRRRIPTCLLLDVRMPGMSGLALFERLVARDLHLAMPVIFLTGHADVPTAVASVKHGAFDFCEKPFSDNLLVDRVGQAISQSSTLLAQRSVLDSVQTRLAGLTDREKEVMLRVVQGLPNKLIADQLAISVRTVEVHRSRVFEKMDIKSAVELANLLQNK